MRVTSPSFCTTASESWALHRARPAASMTASMVRSRLSASAASVSALTSPFPLSGPSTSSPLYSRTPMSKAAAFAVPVLLTAFVGLYLAAAWQYPGGTWEEPTRVGHSFLFNYYCDLMRPVALNGQP